MATDAGKFERPGTQRANQALTNVFTLPSPRKAKKPSRPSSWHLNLSEGFLYMLYGIQKKFTLMN